MMGAMKAYYGEISEQLGFGGDLDEPAMRAIRAFEMLRRIEEGCIAQTVTMPVDLYDKMADLMLECGYDPSAAQAATIAARGGPANSKADQSESEDL